MTALRSLLSATGLNVIEVDLWTQFIGAVLEALTEAIIRLKTSAEWSAFCEKKGALGAKRKTGAFKGVRIPAEDAVSLELADRMWAYLLSSNDLHILKKLHVAFDCEARLPDGKRTGKHSNRADIRARSGRNAALEFVLEAKVLETEGHISGRLLGAEGLGCFTRAAPYSSSPVAGLIAYVFDHDEPWWLKRLGMQLPTKRATRVTLTALHPGGAAVLASIPRSQRRRPLAVIGMAKLFATG